MFIRNPKYRLSIALTLLTFVYLAVTEIPERWNGALRLWNESKEKEQMTYSPEELIGRKNELISRKRMLTGQLSDNSEAATRNQLGLVKLLTSLAKDAGVTIKVVVPLPARSAGQGKELGFKLQATGTYHQAGSFINALERGALSMGIQRLELHSTKPGGSLLAATIEGTAYIFSLDE